MIHVLDHGRIVQSGIHDALIVEEGPYRALMGGQLSVATAAPDRLVSARSATVQSDDVSVRELGAVNASFEPTNSIVRAEGMGWLEAFRSLFRHVVPWRAKLIATFIFGVTRVLALIGVGVLSALAVARLKSGEPYETLLYSLLIVAPLAGILHWLESWFAHDMAFRMLAEMRVALFKKLDDLAPAYLLRRRTGDLVAMATHDVEMVEYFFAHTVAPAFVAMLVPTAVLTVLGYFAWPLAAALLPFLVVVGVTPFFMRHRLDHLGSRDREALGDLNAHAVDTIQGLVEVIAFRQVKNRRNGFLARMQEHLDARLPFYADLSLQNAVLEVATGLGALAIVVTGAYLTQSGSIDSGLIPLLTLLAIAAFLPVSEIAHIGRQLADTLGATRRLHAVHDEPVVVLDGPKSGPEGALMSPRWRLTTFDLATLKTVQRL